MCFFVLQCVSITTVLRSIDKNIKKKATAKKEHRTNILRFLNNASEKELQTLPQIGEKTAYSLFTYR